ncbi:MAG: hypothetical protein EBY28_25605, partial [Betaproteobacteria bacterium]|nr:hypothetical protein [Betaproteobacteria bacterium]
GISLTATGANSDIVLNADLVAGAGGGWRDASGGGAINLSAVRDIVQAAGSTIDSGGGAVSLMAGRDIVVGRIVAARYVARLADRVAPGATLALGGDVSLTATRTLSLADGSLAQPSVSAKALRLQAASIAAMALSVDELSASATSGDLVFKDFDGFGKANSGLRLRDVQASAGNVNVSSEASLSVDKVRVANGGNITLESLSKDIVLLLQDALGALGTGGQLGQLALFAAGFISSGRLFTGKTRTEYRSGGALRIGNAVTAHPADTAVIEPASSFASALTTDTLVLRSDAYVSLSSDKLPMGKLSTSITARDGLFVSQAGLAQIDATAPALLTITAPRLVSVDSAVFSAGQESEVLAQMMPASSAQVQMLSSPTLSLIDSLAVTPGVASGLVFGANAFGSSSTALTVTLVVPTGASLQAQAASGVSITGAEGSRSFSGTAAALSSYFNTVGRLSYNGAAGLLTVQVSSAQASTQTQVQLLGSVISVAPTISQLPSQLFISSGNASQLVFTGASFAGTGDLTLSLTTTSGSLSATSASGIVVGGTAQALTLTGQAAALASF